MLVAGVGPLSGKGPRVIVSADMSILPQSVFVRGGATGAALEYPERDPYSVKNWNDYFFWVDEFVVPASARFGWFSRTNIVKDRAPTVSEYNVEHANTLIAQASPFLRAGEVEMNLNAFIRTNDPRKVRIVERARTENERPIMTVAKHHTVTLLPTSVLCPSGELCRNPNNHFTSL
ncbi:hypothetical protein Tco_1104704 [Tanacetum coccineum]